MNTRTTWALSLTLALVAGTVLLVSLRNGEVPERGARRPGDPGPNGKASPGEPAESGALESAGAPSAGRDLPPDLSLEGRATEGETGRPLADTRIVVRLEQGSRSETRKVTTDGTGRFAIRGVPAGLYRVTFEHPEHFPLQAEMEIVEGEPILGLEVPFDPGTRVRGRVSGLAGEQPCSATVIWRSVADPAYSRQVVTEEGGEYEVGGLVPGDYEVTVTPAKLAAAWSRSPTTIQVTLGDEKRVTVDLEAEMGAGLLVEVSSRDGEPIPDVQVRYTVNREGRGSSGFLPATGPAGYTRVCGLPRDGRLLLEVPPGVSGTARQALDLSDLPREVRLLLAPTPVVEGQALDAEGRPRAGARVAAARGDGGIEEVTHTDDAGGFRLHGLEPGEWELRASLESPPLGTVENIRVPPDSSLRSVRLTLTPDAAVYGTVVDPSGAPVAGALVRLRGETAREETRSTRSGGFVFAVPRGQVWEVIVETSGERSPILMRGVVPGRSVRIVLPSGD